jgi:hypothetical protein
MDKPGYCPGCDVNDDTPIGCFVMKGVLVKMGVIHQ